MSDSGRHIAPQQPPRRRKRTQSALAPERIPDFAERLRVALIGHEAARVAKEIGVARSSFYKWLAGRFEPSLAKLQVFSSITNVNLDWLITGRGEMRPGELLGYLKPNYPSGQFPPLAFERRWLEKNIPIGPGAEEIRTVIAPGKLHAEILLPVLIEVRDDAMEPTFRRGDLLLARRDVQPFRDRTNGIYLIARIQPEPGEKAAGPFLLDSEGKLVDRLFARRVEWTALGSAIIKCDNAAYPLTVELPGDDDRPPLQIAGRVVWQGRLI